MNEEQSERLITALENFAGMNPDTFYGVDVIKQGLADADSCGVGPAINRLADAVGRIAAVYERMTAASEKMWSELSDKPATAKKMDVGKDVPPVKPAPIKDIRSTLEANMAADQAKEDGAKAVSRMVKIVPPTRPVIARNASTEDIKKFIVANGGGVMTVPKLEAEPADKYDRMVNKDLYLAAKKRKMKVNCHMNNTTLRILLREADAARA